jgi:flagellar basal body rod protein FlgG
MHVEERTMDSGYYAALTGLVARTQALDIASTNLANAQTPGYRAEQEYFRSVLLGPDGEDMVLAQRAYESNSKVIKAADDMYSQVNNMTH